MKMSLRRDASMKAMWSALNRSSSSTRRSRRTSPTSSRSARKCTSAGERGDLAMRRVSAWSMIRSNVFSPPADAMVYIPMEQATDGMTEFARYAKFVLRATGRSVDAQRGRPQRDTRAGSRRAQSTGCVRWSSWWGARSRRSGSICCSAFRGSRTRLAAVELQRDGVRRLAAHA